MGDMVFSVNVPALQQLHQVRRHTYSVQFAEELGPIDIVKSPFKINKNLQASKNRKTRSMNSS
jgi:hypothetical protein